MYGINIDFVLSFVDFEETKKWNIFERHFKRLLDHKETGELYINDFAAFSLKSENPRTIDLNIWRRKRFGTM